MEMLEETTLNSKYVAVTVNNGIIKLLSSYAETPTDIDKRTESRTLDTGILSQIVVKIIVYQYGWIKVLL